MAPLTLIAMALISPALFGALKARDQPIKMASFRSLLGDVDEGYCLCRKVSVEVRVFLARHEHSPPEYRTLLWNPAIKKLRGQQESEEIVIEQGWEIVALGFLLKEMIEEAMSFHRARALKHAWDVSETKSILGGRPRL